MTEVLHSASSSSPSPSSSPPTISTPTQLFQSGESKGGVKERDQLSLLALLVALFRKSFWLACKTDREELCGGGGGVGGGMEIGWPTNVRHVAHVTFDRFNGFLGLPVEFEPEVPRRAPSASTTVFGVSTESMQLSFDSRGNSIPTILLLMQRRLYAQGGLQAEGIFRINAENSQEEYVRDQLNRGVVPEGIDVHCLAGLIKAWFRELPSGILDSLSQEQVIQCQSEEDCSTLVRLLPTTEASLLDWAINLMADVVQEEHLNKMNARNIAMVFAPNMTQMADPLTALMYAVQVMNFLRTLIEKTLRERKDSVVEPTEASRTEPSGENGHQDPPKFTVEDPGDTESLSDSNPVGNLTDEYLSYSASTEESEESSGFSESLKTTPITTDCKLGQSSDSNQGKDPVKTDLGTDNICKGISNLSRINSMTERIEAWR